MKIRSVLLCVTEAFTIIGSVLVWIDIVISGSSLTRWGVVCGLLALSALTIAVAYLNEDKR